MKKDVDKVGCQVYSSSQAKQQMSGTLERGWADMTTNAIAIARADRRALKASKVMDRTKQSFAFRLGALLAMGGEGRTM